MKRSLILLILVLAFSACKELFLQIRENIIRTGVVNFVGSDNAIVTGLLLDVADENGEPVLAHGHCWATTENPTLEVNEGFIDYGPAQQFGEFISLLNDLSPETIYYVRAFAQDASGVQYGDNIRFIPGLVTTDFVTNISTNTAWPRGP
ncbi:MAG: hypothetical protein HC913_10830 [Microscillaceae bacterium]|nr:hypothetical protein [Microscillaceae bacterium]